MILGQQTIAVKDMKDFFTKMTHAAILLGIIFPIRSVAEPPAAILEQLKRPEPAIQDVATHESLKNTFLQAKDNDPINSLKPVRKSGSESEGETVKRDLLSDSVILCLNGKATLTPIRAILHAPERLSERFTISEGAKFVSFRDFAKQNKHWLKTFEVTRDQARGLVPVNPESLGRLRQTGAVIVATFKGGPISVLPLVEQADPEPNP